MTLFPWTDWQFWLVTAIAWWCAWTVFRQFLPREKSPTSCGACAAGAAACAKPAAAKREAEPQLVVLSSRRRD